MSALTAAARWIAGKRDLTAELSRLRSELGKLEAARPKSIDVAEHRRWAARRAELMIEVAAQEGALAIATAESAKAEAAQRAMDEGAAHKAEERLAAADTKLVRDLESAIAKVAELRDRLAASNNRTAAYNKIRGRRPYVMPAEERVRRQPERVVPASYRDENVWEDGNGIRPMTYKTARNGELVPTEAGRYQRKRVTVCLTAERTIPSRMPESYVSAIKLVNIEGQLL